MPLEDESVDGIVTSPPYSTAIDYLKENRGAPEFWKISPELAEKYRKITRNMDAWFEMMEKAISEMVRVLGRNRKCAIIMGNQRRGNEIISLVDWTIQRFEKEGCMLLHNIPQLISSTGTWNILVDHILIFIKK